MADLKRKVENLTTPKRTGAKVTCKWEVPAACKKSNASDSVRFDGLDMLWVFDAVPSTKGTKKAKGDVIERDATNKNTQYSDTETFARKSFYPFKGKPKMATAEFWIRGYNTQSGKRHYGPYVSKSLAFKAPGKPELELTYNSSNGKVSCSFSTESPDGARERYDTQVWVEVDGSKKVTGSSYTGTEVTVGTWDVPSASSLGVGKWKKATAKARNRGLFGDSPYVSTSKYIFHPNPPVCKAPELVYATPGTLSTAMVRVGITDTGTAKDGGKTIYPATVKLQRLKESTIATDATAAASASGWGYVTGAEDDGKTSGLSDTWSDGVSAAGKYTWYRAVAQRDGYTVYGVPVQAKCINVPASSGSSSLPTISLTAGSDGGSATATLTGMGASDAGYEVSWAEDADAWNSTEPPSTYETASSPLVIKGLAEGVQFHAKARTYSLDGDGNKVYSSYSDMATFTPYSTPSTVTLSGAGTTPRGSDLLLTWTYDTDAAQTAWMLVDSAGNVAYSGEGSSCAKVITPEEYGSASSLSYRVEMTTGGGWARSEQMTFNIADAPTCSITVSDEVSAQPISFTVASDKGDNVGVVLTALGSSGTGLYGDVAQYAGDTVHSATYSPEWTVSDNVRSGTVTLPEGLTLFNGASYLLEVTANDVDTGLDSPAASATVAIDWTHTAQQPTATAVADSASKSVTVTVSAPAGYAAGDRFDLYRVTADGERRIASAQPFGTAITDRLAPYTFDGANLRYLAVTRTADGDACISDDIAYTLKGADLRLDWAQLNIGLPYDLDLSDTVGKNSEVRTHLDGSRHAYWNEGATRRASLSTDLIRFEDYAQQELLRNALQYAGSVFVRTPDGLAFAADVQPGTIQRSAGSAIVGVSITANEHDLTAEDMPNETDIAQPSWGGGAVEAVDGVVYDATGGFPMDDWTFIGYASSELYVCDPDGVVRDGDGAEQADWVWDGLTLYDENGDPVEVSEE